MTQTQTVLKFTAGATDRYQIRDETLFDPVRAANQFFPDETFTVVVISIIDVSKINQEYHS